MIDIHALAAKVSPSGVSGAGAAGQPNPADVDLFRQGLGGSSPSQAVTPSGFVSESITEGIKQAAESYRARFEALHAGLQQAEKTRSLGDLMRWQLESSRVGVEMEFTGKMASKITQDIEQLTKQQG